MPVVKPSNNVYYPSTKTWTTEPPSTVAPGVGHANATPIPSLDPEKIAREKVDKLWATQARLSNFGTLYNAIEAQFPTFTHTISVSIVGGPKADIRTIWLLCLSTAFGRYRQGSRAGIQAGQLQATWDITGKACQVIITYANSGIEGIFGNLYEGAQGGLTNAINNVPLAAAMAPAFPYIQALEAPTIGDFLYAGPTQETVGGDTLNWLNGDGVAAAAAVGAVQGYAAGTIGGMALNFATGGAASAGGATTQRLATVGAIAGAVASGLAQSIAQSFKARPQLPDTNRLITTADKTNPNVQPPAPSGDGISRTFPWVALVSNALTAPCYLPAFPPAGAQVENRTPVYYPATPSQRPLNSNKVQGYTANTPVNTDTNIQVVLQTLDDLTSRKDGYPPIPSDLPLLEGPVNNGR